MPLTLTRWHEAMLGDAAARAEAVAAFDAALIIHAQTGDVSDLWGGLPWQLAVRPIGILAWRLGRTDVLEAMAERNIQIDGSAIAVQGDWIDSLTIEQLGLTVFVSFPWAQSPSRWSGLLLGAVATRRTLDPFDVAWTEPDDTSEELICIASEALVDPAQPLGDWILTKRYYRAAHVQQQPDLSLAVRDISEEDARPWPPTAETIQRNTAGPFGPLLRHDTHRLYRLDGSYIEQVRPSPKLYDRDAMVDAGQSRRVYAVRSLTGQIGVMAASQDPTGALGQQVMAAVLPVFPVLVEAGTADLVVAALGDWPAFQAVAQARLAPWLTPS